MFSISSCPKCGGGYFKTVEKEPQACAYKVIFVQCSTCNTPVGVMDYYNLGTLLKQQEKKIDELGSRIDQLCLALQQIANALQR